MPAYTGPNAIPAIFHHEIGGPLEANYFESLGRFIFAFTSTEDLFNRELRSALAEYAGGKNAWEVVKICTNGAPTRQLMYMSEAAWHRRFSPSEDHMKALARARDQFILIQELRNLLTHEPAYPDHFTEEPQASLFRTTTKTRTTNSEEVRITISALRAATKDVGAAGYIYRCLINNPTAVIPSEYLRPWLYTKDSLIRARIQSTKSSPAVR